MRSGGGGFAASIYKAMPTFRLLPPSAGRREKSALGFLPSNIRGGQPRLAPLGSPFQRKGREDGLGDARSLKLTVLSYLKPNP